MATLAQYGRLLTEAYDLDKPEAPADALEACLAFVRDCPVDGPVLEAMSGSGRFLLPMLAAGIDIEGVDASPHMLAACMRRAAELGLAPVQYEQLLHELDLPRRYACAFVVAGSFGLVIDQDEVRESLWRLHEHLVPGGTLLLEVETTKAVSPAGRWFGRWWTRPDGARIVMRTVNAYDESTQIETGLGIYELFVDGALVETELNDWVRRFWEPAQINDALAAAGFVDISVSAEDDLLLECRARAPT